MIRLRVLPHPSVPKKHHSNKGRDHQPRSRLEKPRKGIWSQKTLRRSMKKCHRNRRYLVKARTNNGIASMAKSRIKKIENGGWQMVGKKESGKKEQRLNVMADFRNSKLENPGMMDPEVIDVAKYEDEAAPSSPKGNRKKNNRKKKGRKSKSKKKESTPRRGRIGQRNWAWFIEDDPKEQRKDAKESLEKGAEPKVDFVSLTKTFARSAATSFNETVVDPLRRLSKKRNFILCIFQFMVGITNTLMSLLGLRKMYWIIPLWLLISQVLMVDADCQTRLHRGGLTSFHMQVSWHRTAGWTCVHEYDSDDNLGTTPTPLSEPIIHCWTDLDWLGGPGTAGYNDTR